MNTSKHFLLYSIGYFTTDSRNFHSFKDVFKNLLENSLGLEGKKSNLAQSFYVMHVSFPRANRFYHYNLKPCQLITVSSSFFKNERQYIGSEIRFWFVKKTDIISLGPMIITDLRLKSKV